MKKEIIKKIREKFLNRKCKEGIGIHHQYIQCQLEKGHSGWHWAAIEAYKENKYTFAILIWE